MENFFVGSSAYEWPHITLLISLLVVGVALFVLTHFFCKNAKQNWIAAKIFAGIILICTILSRFIYADFNITIDNFLPNTFCSFMGFAFPIAVLLSRKDNNVLNLFMWFGLFGGLLTILEGGFVGQEAWDNTIISFTYHGFMFLLAIFLMAKKLCVPTLDKIKSFVLLGCVYVTFALFVLQVLGKDICYLTENLVADTPLSWWLVGLLIVVIVSITSIIYEACTRPKNEQNIVILYEKIKNKFQIVFCKNKAKEGTDGSAGNIANDENNANVESAENIENKTNAESKINKENKVGE